MANLADARRYFCAFCGTNVGERLYGDNAPCGGCGRRPFYGAEPADLRDAIEIEREGQRSMARALAEINRLSRLDVAISLPAPPPPPAQDAVREAAERLRATLDRTCGKYLGGPRLPLVNDLEEHAARLLAAIDAAKGGE